MIELLRSSEQHRAMDRRALVCLLLCFAFACVAAVMFLPLALAYSGTSTQKVMVAASYVVLVTAAAGMSAQLRFSPVRVPLHTTYTDIRESFWITSLWIGPAIIFSLQRGLASILGIGAFSVVVARVLKRMATPNRQEGQVFGTYTILFESENLDAGNFSWNVLRSALISIAYLGIVAELIGNRLWAVICTGGSWFFLAWVASDWHQQDRPIESIHASRLLMHAGLAIAVTFFALSAHVKYFRLSSPGQSTSETQNSESKNEQLQSGIILFTKTKRSLSPFVPRSLTLHSGPTRLLPEILKIPFSGEYWFSRWPLLRPPASSLREEGDPTTVSVTLTDFGTLVMQARQDIGQSLDVRCCHSINIVLHAGRRHTDAVTMELLIIHSSKTRHNAQSLGVQSLANPIETLMDSAGEFSTNTYKFEMPRRSVIRSFDSLAVWFHLQPPRTRKSAMLSIARFELVP